MQRLITPTGSVYPWPLVAPAEIAGQVCYPGMRAEALPAGCVIEDVPPEPTPDPAPVQPKRYSKLKLTRALREAGLMPAFKAAMAADEAMADDWAAAQELAEDDPMLTQDLPALCAAAGVTVEQAWALLAQAEIAP